MIGIYKAMYRNNKNLLYYYQSLLHGAVKIGATKLVAALIKIGADIQVRHIIADPIDKILFNLLTTTEIIKNINLFSYHHTVYTSMKFCLAANLADKIYKNELKNNQKIDCDTELQDIFFSRLKFNLTNYGEREKYSKLLERMTLRLPTELVNKINNFVATVKQDLPIYEASIMGFVEGISTTPLFLIIKHNNMNKNWQDEEGKKIYFEKYSILYPEVTELIDKVRENTINETEAIDLVKFLEEHQGRYLATISVNNIVNYIPGHEENIETLINTMILPVGIKVNFKQAVIQYNEALAAEPNILYTPHNDILNNKNVPEYIKIKKRTLSSTDDEVQSKIAKGEVEDNTNIVIALDVDTPIMGEAVN